MNTISVEDIVHEKIESLIVKANQLFGKKFVKPIILFDLTGTTAGLAYGVGLIRLNKVLLQENLDKFLETTVPHELAHILSFKLYGTMGHDKYWKHVMVKLGAASNRCHNYDVSNVRKRNITRIEYKCQCRTHMLTSIRHNKIVNNGAKYRCTDCNCRLERV